MPAQLENYYHFASCKLAPGSVVLPGNWGRMLRKCNYPAPNSQYFGNPWVLARELLFDIIRMNHFPDRPSRLECAFCCPSIEDARAYQNGSGVDPFCMSLLHRVELVDPSLPGHTAFIKCTNWPSPNTSFLNVLQQQAKAYWAGEGDGPREFLTMSGLKIVENID